MREIIGKINMIMEILSVVLMGLMIIEVIVVRLVLKDEKIEDK